MDREITNLPSNTNFGFSFSALVVILAGILFLLGASHVAALLLLIATILCVVTALAPTKLSLLNTIWMRFGLFLGKLFTPIMTGAIFFVLISPIAIVTRLFGRDELAIKRSHTKSYWKPPISVTDESNPFRNQF